MSLGFVMLVHDPLRRAGQVSRHLARVGCPIVIHVDARVSRASYDTFRRQLEEFPNVVFCRRHACEWGTWSLVAASQTASEMMLERFPEVRHVYLVSGSCLPLRPIAELRAFLDTHPDTDFIESVTTRDVPWTIGGFDTERFAFSFPFSWKRQRLLFDAAVWVQRKMRRQRNTPEGIVPHLGSQWWCLTRKTLTQIFEDPKRRQFERYFRRVWIPDESYYQTLIRRYARRVESRSLTLSKFDFQGKPHIFYDDHLQLLVRSEAFFARKIWPEADAIYDAFLDRGLRRGESPNPAKIDRVFARAVERRTRGRAGLYMQSRFPNWDWENGRTASPYHVLSGFGDLFEGFERWLSGAAECLAHGHLFGPERAEFAERHNVFAGGLPDSAALRDHNPRAFLTNLLWNTRGERQCFLFGPRDTQEIAEFVASDPNARIMVISGAWAVPMCRSNRDFSELREEAALLQKTEARYLDILRGPHAKARTRIWSMAEFLEDPMQNLVDLVEEVGPRQDHGLTEAPRMRSLQGFGRFLQHLRNEGMNPHIAGDFTLVDGRPETRKRARPALVR
ncbi:DUF5927 domain-containing protein [Ovoidimarina sediminis]|uniref:DUF5927 domain-containing protein n=1 Tax=Ovoidimarina sediminis TaxID=3079856 RepID=UPI002907F7EC|nr:beta-1,6-N-acetylglucosaminyltransferase [Rhodophyticola sp. MJ-SS7]MDU8942397.1 beta-1,6-N-acetylglucosaminyltransferase [Rhodophyticola sp. MJ-SS7]